MKQKLLRMRHAWYLLAACLTLLIPWGGEMQAAPSPQQTSVRVENVTSLKGLIQEIESQTSYRISYQGNLADNVPVKIAKSTKSVSQLLDEALRGTGITYIIRQNNIILTRAAAQSPAAAAPAPAAPRKQHIAGQVSTPRPGSRSSAPRSGSRIRRSARAPHRTVRSTIRSPATSAS